jgi:hypothetical protein
MTLHARTADELQAEPALATLHVLFACIDAVTSTLDVIHPDLLRRDPVSERESAAMLLHMHLHSCQELLRLYDHLSFDVCCFSDSEDEEPEDDIPF